MSVNPEVAQKWADALRSGEYPQSSGVLHNNFGFCCLGVLCDVAVKNGVIPAPRIDSDVISARRFYGAEEASAFLPTEVQDWLGTDGRDVDAPQSVVNALNLYNFRSSFVALNDTHDATFDHIADCIEFTYLREDDES